MRQLAGNVRGQSIAGVLQSIRAVHGVTVTIAGQPYSCAMEVPPKREMDALAEGLGINIANPDIRRVQLSPPDFGSPDLYPQEMSSIFLNEGGAQTEYVVLARNVEVLFGNPTTINLTVYRRPQNAGAIVAPAGEPGAGSPKVYAPNPPS